MRRRTLVLAAALPALAGHAAAQAPFPAPYSAPNRQPTFDDFRMHQDRTREFESRARPAFPPPGRDDAERRARQEGRDRDAADEAARRSADEQDRRRRALPWSAAPWSAAPWSDAPGGDPRRGR